MISDYDFQNADILGAKNDTNNKALMKPNIFKESLDNFLIEGKENVSKNNGAIVLEDSQDDCANLLHHLDSIPGESYSNTGNIDNSNAITIPDYKYPLPGNNLNPNPVEESDNFSDRITSSDQNTLNDPFNFSETCENTIIPKTSVIFSDVQSSSNKATVFDSQILEQNTNYLTSLNDGTINGEGSTKFSMTYPENIGIKSNSDHSSENFVNISDLALLENGGKNAEYTLKKNNFIKDEIKNKNKFYNPSLSLQLNSKMISKQNIESLGNSVQKRDELKFCQDSTTHSSCQKLEDKEMDIDTLNNHLPKKCLNSLPNDSMGSNLRAIKHSSDSSNPSTDSRSSTIALQIPGNSPSRCDLSLNKDASLHSVFNGYLLHSNKMSLDNQNTDTPKLSGELTLTRPEKTCSKSLPDATESHHSILGDNKELVKLKNHKSIIKNDNLNSLKCSNLDLPSSSHIISSKLPQIGASTSGNEEKTSKGLKRPSDEGNEASYFKKLKISSTNENIKDKIEINNIKRESSIEKKNSDYLKALEDGLKASSKFTPPIKDRVTNPNKLYQGLLNDVLAEEKDIAKEPEMVRTKLKKIKRKDLEDMIIEQLMSKILYDHELGGQRELCKRLEQTLEAANKKALRLTQEVESLKNITTKVTVEHKRRKLDFIQPLKVKRSVGIQATKSYISQGFSSAFLPDSEVHLLTPSKYQKVKRDGAKKTSRSRAKGKSKPELDFNEKKDVEDYSSGSQYENLNQKLNTIKETLEASRFVDLAEETPLVLALNKKLKYSKRPALNGKHLNEDTDKGTTSKGATVELRHPAPLPNHLCTDEEILKRKIPPGPILRVHLRNKSIILSWNINENYDESSILSYQLFSYEETNDLPSTDTWQKIGSVKALELPMACTLTQFKCGHVYHFAVRATTRKGRIGPFSTPRSLRMPLN